MPRGILPATLLLLSLFLISLLTNHPSLFAFSDHLLISQVQIASTSSANDEFVELYNPTTVDIDLAGMRLTRTNSTGTTSQNLVASLSGILAPGHYYLISHPSFTSISISPDLVYSASSSAIAANSTLRLYAPDHTTLIDKLGFGTASDFETSPAINPAPGQSLIRTNLQDTDNNSLDFILTDTPDPHNSSFISEPAATPTSSPSVEITTVPPTPTDTPSPSPSPEPTAEIVSTPTTAPEPIHSSTNSDHYTVGHDHNPAPSPRQVVEKIISFCQHQISKFHFPEFRHHFFRR